MHQLRIALRTIHTDRRILRNFFKRFRTPVTAWEDGPGVKWGWEEGGSHGRCGVGWGSGRVAGGLKGRRGWMKRGWGVRGMAEERGWNRVERKREDGRETPAGFRTARRCGDEEEQEEKEEEVLMLILVREI